MGVIRVMPEALANQIAAGEVVERPASCVKELVENSLDAGATQVSVTLEEGGISRIAVQDNGHGMDAQDVVLAFERHATSKVRQPRDLFSLTTLGFRGEALASIAAIAKVTLSSRTHDVEQGVQYRIEGTDIKDGPKPHGMPPGTRVDVNELFYNTPARLKYLRSVSTEQSRCLETVQRISLGRPDVAFTIFVDQQAVFRTDGRGDMKSVLAALYGAGEARQFLSVQGQSSDYRITGYVGRPNQSRASRAHGYLYINGRAIRNIAVHQAVVSAYGTRLMVNRHPMYVLCIEMDPKLVDVNIHPHKAEVRFSEERDLTRLVEETVRGALSEATLVADGSRMFGEARQAITTNVDWAIHREPSALHPKGAVKPLFDPAVRPRTPISTDALRATLQPPSPLESHERASVLAGEEPSESVAERQMAYGESDAPASRPTSDSFQLSLRPVGQAMGMYIVADDGESLYIIDQHAAHEKVLYERFRQERKGQTARIPTLTPIMVSFSAAEISLVQPWLPLLTDLGLTVERFGSTDLAVREVPAIWEGLDIQTLVEATLFELATGSKGTTRDAIEDRLIMRACKAAIKANHRLSGPEMQALCDALVALEDPFHCPHGRPIIIRLTSRDLEKGFKRIV